MNDIELINAAHFDPDVRDLRLRSTHREHLSMVEGLGKGAGLTLLAVPIANAFIFTHAQIQRIAKKER